MKVIALAVLAIVMCHAAPAVDDAPRIPATPALLIDALKRGGESYTVHGIHLDFVKETDLPYLVGLLDSQEPCAFVHSVVSSIHYPGRSTVRHEAAYLIEGFWKRYYPPDLTSQQFKPDVLQIRIWYNTYSGLKNSERRKFQDQLAHPGTIPQPKKLELDPKQ